jgi:ketosteroid isomerase-like protein
VTNVDRYRRSIDAFNRRDLDAFLALMDADVEVGSRQVAIEGAYHGHDGLRRWWADLFDAFPDYTVEVEELRDLGDVMLVRIRAEAQSAHGDTTLHDRFWQVASWLDGKCVWWRNCPTEAEALEAAGRR